MWLVGLVRAESSVLLFLISIELCTVGVKLLTFLTWLSLLLIILCVEITSVFVTSVLPFLGSIELCTV